MKQQMISFKNIVIQCTFTFALVILLQNTVVAQRCGNFAPPPPSDRAAHMTEKMTDDLGLDQAQAAKVNAINLKYEELVHQKMEAFRAKEQHPLPADFEQMKPLMEQKDAELKSVLTDEQYSKHLEFVKNRPPHFAPPPHHFGKKGRFGGKFDPAKKEGLRTAVKAYMHKNVLPTVQQQRLKLEKDITTGDKTTLTDLRGELAKVKPQMKAIHEKMRTAFEQEGWSAKKELKEEMRVVKKQYHDVMQRIKPLADKYSEQMNALRKEIDPDIKQWKSDIQAIVKQELGENKRKFGRHGMRRGALGKLLHKGHFMLLDPSRNLNEFLEDAATDKGNRQFKNVYPNPANDSNVIEFEVENSDNINIDLYDKDGQFVKTILSEYKEVGTYTVTVNLENLPRSTYYYVLKDGKGKEVKRFLIAN